MKAIANDIKVDDNCRSIGTKFRKFRQRRDAEGNEI